VLAKRWISECCQHHASCRDAVGTSRFRPTRLVDVGPPDGSQQLRLSLKTGDDSAVQYLALSYCWGTSNVYKLTSNTAGEMSRGFPASKLPQTLQDAVNACRKLKQRYIWIDSLCIFQDSEVDWRQEAAQMGLVYTHALCTIAAVCARDSSEGFFSRRNPRVRQPCSFPTKIKISTCRLFSRLHYHKIQPKQPLYSRAWVLQERVLSPRILKFGLEAVSWECSESLLYEAKQT
ncbi:HET-domain-containing protein, partial [Cryphonectria parasitica EP155]